MKIWPLKLQLAKTVAIDAAPNACMLFAATDRESAYRNATQLAAAHCHTGALSHVREHIGGAALFAIIVDRELRQSAASGLSWLTTVRVLAWPSRPDVASAPAKHPEQSAVATNVAEDGFDRIAAGIELGEPVIRIEGETAVAT
jgi:hypothetical protein